MPENKQKTVLFFPLNSPGHINSSLGIADVMRREHNIRTAFLILGKMMGTSILDHGHELIMLKEVSPYEDFEIKDDEDTSIPVDEAARLAAGEVKNVYEGVYKWPQVLRRYSHLLRLEPAEAFVASVHIMEKNMVGELMDNHDNYKKAIDEIKPDLIIIDAYYVPPCVVKSPVPWARLYSANPLMLVKSKLPDGVKPAPMCGFQLFDKNRREIMRNEQPGLWKQMVQDWRDTENYIYTAMGNVGGSLNKFLESHDCTPLPPGQQAHDSPFMNVYMFPEALDYDQDDDIFEYPKLWFRCDSLMRQAAQAGSQEASELNLWRENFEKASVGKEAIVFFSLGSLASGNCMIMKRFVEMLRHDQKKLFVFSKGANGDKYELDENNMIGGNYIPQTYFLQKADMVIIHGGNNSVTECMYFGKPMIVLPVFADQIDNAQRIEDLGYGRRLDVYNCTQEELSKTIDEILNDKLMRDRMANVAKKMQSKDDLAKVTRSLVDLAHGISISQDGVNNNHL